jgi:hypothetical protein
MAQAIALAHRRDSLTKYGDTKWIHSLHINPKKEMKDDASPDQRIVATFQEVSLSGERDKVDKTSQYLFSAEDKNGRWLDGGKFYQLHIPGNNPAKQFWSITVYDNSTWMPIQNDEPRNSFNSKQSTYLTNGDGSVDVFFGLIAPAGEGTNWIRTLPNKGWFVYLRLNDASETFFNKSWPLGDIEEVSGDVWKGRSNRQ